jgi:putative ABC transport system substrate-binding protein
MLLGGTAVAWPLAARAQQQKIPTIGFLGSATSATLGQWVAAFVQHLRELGWIEGRTVAIELRWAEGRTERYAEIAAEFVRLNVDVIVTGGTPTALAAKRATAVIPIVFAMTGDPVGTGLVAHLARPGGNLTGLSTQTTDTVSKRIELLREVVPNLRRLAILANINSPIVALEMGEAHGAANTLGLEVVTLEVGRAQDIERTFETLGRADGLYVCADPLVSANRTRINALALAARLPTVAAERQYVEAGLLASYGIDQRESYRRGASYVDRILKGAKPGDLPIEFPTRIELAINLKTAKTLGLDMPPSLVTRADEVIE